MSDQTQLSDDDLVYVDPNSKTVVGRVEWGRVGNPKSLSRPVEEVAEGGRRHRFYPWGTYRAVKRAFNLEGKGKEEPRWTLDEALEKAFREPYF